MQKLSDGRVAEWLMAADCKSADLCLRKFESFPFHQFMKALVSGAFCFGLKKWVDLDSILC